jgi:hypothetical protein
MRILLDLGIDQGRLYIRKVLQEGNEGIVRMSEPGRA